MFCPRCKGEFRPGFTQCDTCGVSLVERLSEPDPPRPSTPAPAPALTREEAVPVTVLRTGDPGLMAVAKSLMQSEGIPYMVPGEGVQDLAGLGRIGGFNIVFGPVELQVRARDADVARALLEGIADGEPVGFEDDAFGDGFEGEYEDESEDGPED